MAKKYVIKYKYRDESTHWKWQTRSCVVSSAKEFRELFEGIDCEYETTSIKRG